jgi:hypothetical protein
LLAGQVDWDDALDVATVIESSVKSSALAAAQAFWVELK